MQPARTIPHWVFALALTAVATTAWASEARPRQDRPGASEPSSGRGPAPLRLQLDSGALANPRLAARTVFSEVVTVPGAAWLRLHFGSVELDKGSRLRVSSIEDGASQFLDAAELRKWRDSSAYFNGDSVLVELVAGPATNRNRVVISEVSHERTETSRSICEPDDRVPSNDPFSGRIFPKPCTGTIWGSHGCIITAGHCIDYLPGAEIIEFNVPTRDPVTCALRHPPVADQFPLSNHTFEDSTAGDDWGVVRTLTNSSGETVFERYGGYRRIALEMPSLGEPVTIWGYGATESCATSDSQQRSDGQVTLLTGGFVAYDADTRSGNSGSGVVHDDEVIAVHAHGGLPGERRDPGRCRRLRAGPCQPLPSDARDDRVRPTRLSL